MELLIEFQARYPGMYSLGQLYTLQTRVRTWRQQPFSGSSAKCPVTSSVRQPITKLR